MADTKMLLAGMDVLSSDGKRLGCVKAASKDGKYFHVDCPMALDLYVPVEEIAEIEEGVVRLRVTEVRAANMGWEAKPPGA